MADHLFTPEALQQIIANLPAPDSAKPHTMIGSVDSNGAQVAVMMTFADKWTVEGIVKHDWSGDNSVGAKFIGKW